MILKKGHKHRRREVQSWGATPLLLPRIVLPLVQVAVLEGGDQFLRGAQIIGVIGFVAPGDGDHGAVVEVVVPEHVQAIAALRWGADQLRVLGFVLIDQQGGAPTRRLPHPAGDGRQDVVRGGIIDILRGIEAQAVKVEFLDPVARIGQEELADGAGMRIVVVEGLAPVRGVAVA